jgi:flavin-dependent dehydrogenase
MHIRRDHYVGVAPVPGGITNVCVVSESHGRLGNPAAALLQSIQTHADLRERFTNASMVSPAVSMGPLAVDATACGIPGLLLAGDASGFIDPMTGDGLRFAIVGGELAGRAALAALADGRAAHRRLARWRRRAFGRKHAFNRTLRAIVAAPRAVSAASAAARIAPWTVSRLIAVAGDVH